MTGGAGRRARRNYLAFPAAALQKNDRACYRPVTKMKIIERLAELQELQMGPKAGDEEVAALMETIRKEIPAPILGHYDRLLVRGKKGVALVTKGVCGGCRMQLASGARAKLMRDDDIVMCDSCARYLLLVPAAPAPAPVAPAKRPSTKRGRPKGSKNKPALEGAPAAG